ncbi:MAG TPA: AI-2E family transporter, partial [Kofleriaceae bacterium]
PRASGAPIAPPGEHRLASREALVFWVVGALVLGVVVVLHVAADVLLLTFAGLLFGNALRGAAEWLSRRTRSGVGQSLVVCILGLLALGAGAVLWVAPLVADQAGQLESQLGAAIADLQAWLSRTQLVHALSTAQPGGLERQATGWLTEHAGFAGSFLLGVGGVLGAVVYVLFVTLYFAFSPAVYRRGMLALVPPGQRARAEQLLDALTTTLRRWLGAQLITMVALAIASGIGLRLLGIPLAFALGLLAGVLLFVPYLGSIASAIPALLIALTVSPMHVLYVALLYLGIHLAEGYLLSPLLQRRAVDTPALLVLGSQLIAGALWGILGLMFATPIVATVLVVVRMLYVEDTLGSDQGR